MKRRIWWRRKLKVQKDDTREPDPVGVRCPAAPLPGTPVPCLCPPRTLPQGKAYSRNLVMYSRLQWDQAAFQGPAYVAVTRDPGRLNNRQPAQWLSHSPLSLTNRTLGACLTASGLCASWEDQRGRQQGLRVTGEAAWATGALAVPSTQGSSAATIWLAGCWPPNRCPHCSMALRRTCFCPRNANPITASLCSSSCGCPRVPTFHPVFFWGGFIPPQTPKHHDASVLAPHPLQLHIRRGDGFTNVAPNPH
ncbi:uncharacterized protein LOC117018779 [Rhinolophus ferrumequinum]|uniref:uncharacterized protein LOC117018779 n=1 Tax=Rhinolophus ferrumequinum TaxID=59479 RepID=UPI00140F8E83|nr:uncharacterized protein LOC117018779 [Rhinolophus ferrumequinum]